MIFGKHLIFGSLMAPSLCGGSAALETQSDIVRIDVDSQSVTDTKSSAVLRAGRFEIVTLKQLEPIFRAVQNGDVDDLQRLVSAGPGSCEPAIAVQLTSHEARRLEQN